MRYGFITLLISIYSGLIKPVSAQQYIFKNYTVNDGLVANFVRNIFQDKKGFMWFGTQEGLSKYDGHHFTNYTTGNGLTNAWINDFYETADGTLYVAPNDGSVVVAAENSLVPCIKPSETIIGRFFQAPDGRIIVATDYHGLAEFRNNKLYSINQPFPYSIYGEITGLNDSLFFVSSDSSLQVLTYRYELFSWMKEHNSYFTDCKILKDSKQRIWVGSYRGLKQIQWPTKKGEPLSFLPLPSTMDIPALRQNTITAIFEDNKQVLWIGTNNGLIKINPDGSHQLLTNQDGLADGRITNIFQDREMNIWFGTFGGVSKLVTSSGIQIYTSKNGLVTERLISASRLKKDNMLLLSPGSPIDPNKPGILQIFNTKTETATTVTNPSGIYFQNIVLNSEAPLLLGYGQICLFDTLSGHLKKAYTLDNGYYYLAAADSNKNFFLSTTESLFFTNGKRRPLQILNKRTQCVITDENGFLWAGTWWDGLYRFKYTVQSDSIYIQSKKQYFPDERFRSIFIDSEGNIWAGTRQHGVYIFKAGNPADYLVLNQSNGLLSDFVKQIAEDKEGNIWLTNGQGVDKLVKKDNRYSVFSFSRVNNFYSVVNSMEYDGNNSIWLATLNGLVRITDTKMDNTGALPVYITKISSPDSVYSASAQALRLNYRKNQLQFEFSAPGFINEKQILYSYRLTGSENNEWSQLSNEHAVSFASLRAGSYNFEVRSQGWNGEWGKATSFSFEILPPFWQTWWFRIACALFIIGISIWLVRRRIKHIRYEAELKHKTAEAEMAALRSQMNPHFIFNCLNAIDNLIQSDQQEKATTYLARFAKLIRNVLESSKNNTVLFQKDMESLNLYLQIEEFRSNNKFNYELTAEQELMHSDFRIPPLVIQPFVENAIHHGLLNKLHGERKLTVSAKLENNYIYYSITDSGVGRAKAGEIKAFNKPGNQSYGIDITRERLHLHNQDRKTGDIKITDLYTGDEPAGTKVEIWVKIYDSN